MLFLYLFQSQFRSTLSGERETCKASLYSSFGRCLLTIQWRPTPSVPPRGGSRRGISQYGEEVEKGIEEPDQAAATALQK